MMHSSLEGHRTHLRALVRQEQAAAYKRHDYLSREWQLGLWQDGGRATPQLHDTESRPSPSSVTTLADDGGTSVPSAPTGMCGEWREKIVEWKYQVVDRLDLDREVVGISTFYLDQYLSMHYVDEKLFQLVSMTCIYLAIKLHSPKKMAMQSIVALGNGLVTAQHIEAMELSIMKCLNWHLFPPTAIAFIENIFPLIAPISANDGASADRIRSSRHQRALQFSRYLIELSVCVYPFVCAQPSSVALAAVLYSLEYCGLPLRDGGEEIDAKAPEVEVCGRLLRKVHRLALPSDAAD